ncbi:carboxypeptidase-like regulatory domain-containing protein [Flavobacterium sp. LC2016-12]|uniref:carboxypeptidase-like regulatory domain-containing protein n=1 Tax=Flavobacterium sp. LC2016-12 TaxID=2783794 RepID=UPI00188D88BD|nr:carboxypeptidase-like regulatory domain-containing protein [Flavobacterium sp. LC2016-12]MBF4464550.1 carboxypeptidase-like regulatory domain-containing protein [Flavobacterium sp. LC2016-12]
MKKLLIVLLAILPVLLFSQNTKVSGIIKDNTNRGIESASVVIMDSNDNTLSYCFTNENGYYELEIDQPKDKSIIIEISSLGFTKERSTILIENKTSIQHSITLESKEENLKEVVIESYKKIKRDQDTTTIKVSSFLNNTEQTVEDVLKKLPGIEVQKDGSIKAHGKSIDKLLIEGEDLFDKNYKLLSKNLDGKVLDAVQIIDAFEDNPILKKMNNSDKVALNLKLKKDKQNIWFGNITAGAGIVSENRWKEGINLGLLKKKIKLFYLADYNNSGEKASSLIQDAIISSSVFGEDRIEKAAKKQYTINSNENSSFSKSQSIFNKAFFNSLSFTSKIKPSLTIRGVGYFTNDNQIQNSISETIYNVGETPIINNEANAYISKKSLSSGEIELKYLGNDDNYLTNLFIYKNNPNTINSNLLFNNAVINQSSNNKNQTFYNHFNHTYSITNRTILHNYFYFGNDNLNEKNNLKSPFLNEFLQTNPNALIKQNTDNKNQYFGIKNKLISKYRTLETALTFQYEKSNESIFSNFFIDQNNNTDYEVNTKLKQSFFSLDGAVRYNFSVKANFTANLKYIQNNFRRNNFEKNYSLLNPNFTFKLEKTSIGNFSISYAKNNSFPEINFLTTDYLLTDYRTFTKGIITVDFLQNKIISFSHAFYNDEKRFSIDTNLSYIKSKKTLNSENEITENFNFQNYIITEGGESFNGNFSLVNYFRKLKWATKLETRQNWSNNPTKVNSQEFSNLKSYNSLYTFSATTYYNIPVNFDFGFNYNYYQTNFNSIITSNETKDAFINCNYKISKTWLAEFNSTFYEMNSKNYTFINLIVNCTPEKSRFSYRLLFNNISNQNEFTLVTLDNYTSYKSTIRLVPRYLLATVKYRF